MKRIEDTICEAIELIVNKAVDNASYDKTIQGIIKSCVDEATGKYLVQYQDSTFYAYSSNLDYTYSNGVSVYVLVPGNDMSDNKTIIGTVDNLGIDYINQASKEDLFNKIGASCINNSEGTFDLSSYREHNSPTEGTKTRYIEVLYDADAEHPENNRLDINEEFADLYLVDASSILCSGFFKTNFDLYQKNQGNYGIIFGIDFYDNASEEGEVANPSIVTRYYFIDVDNMEGNPYELTSGKRQYNIFDIDGENFYRISSISVFTEGFPNHKSDIEIEEQELYDISISDIELYAVEQMSEEEIASCGVAILTPQGTFFGANSVNTSLTLKAQVKVKGKLINSDNLSFYWFKENLAVNASNYKYNQYGGRGWECLNPYNVIVEGDDEVSRQIEWVPAKDTYEVNLSLVTATKTNFKCVVIYNDVAYNKIVAIENRKSGVPTITIESDSGTQFYYNVGRPNLTCKINGNEEASYTYVWAKQDAYGNVTILPEDSTKNNTDYSNYSNAVSALETLNASIAAGTAHKNASAATIASLENTINSYKYTQMVHQNKLLKVAINEITNFAIFKCSVYNGDTYLGTASITLSNSLQTERNYSLVINEGNQTYQYNEYGVSPASKSLEKYITIPALTFTVYDSNGKPLSEEALRECGVAWKVPSSRSMLVSINAGDAETETDEEGYTYYYDVNTISYKIRDKFYYDYKNNDIELFVDYKDQELVAKTNLTFIKQGDDGTNGTSYSCKIVPNTENYFESYPTFTTLSNGTSGTFNFNNFVLTNEFSDTAPFVVKLYKSGEEIFSDSESGTTNKTDTGEDIDILVQWGMLANTYDTTNYDLSDFDINSADGHMKFTNAANNASRIGANSIKCTVNFTDIDGRLNVLYATLPINVVRLSSVNYRIALNDNTGFRYVVYSSDGTNPKYDDTKPFELTVYETINNIEEEISDLTNSNLYYVWGVEGDYYDFYTTNGTYIDSKDLIYQNFRINSNQGRVKPAPSYNGLCVNNRVYCEVHTGSASGTLVGRIDIPVNLFLNRYGFAHLNAWDGNSIQLNEEGGFILAPQIGAGKKESDNSFTGVLMGEVRDPNKENTETGLFGYAKGERSFFLDAETGNAYFRGTISNGDKDSLESTGSGLFIDKDGDFSVGDDSQYIKWIDDELNIQAKSFMISISDSETKDIQEIASEADAASTQAVAAAAAALDVQTRANNGEFDGADGTDGRGISSTEVRYAEGTDGNTAPLSGWQSTVPTITEGNYLWTRVTTNYTSGNPSISYSVSRQGVDGTGVTISSTEIKYAVSTNGTQPPDSFPYSSPQTTSTGQYLWTRTVVNYSDGNSTTAYSCAAHGATGPKGDKGDTGVSITSVTNYYLASNLNSGVTKNTSGWKTDVSQVTLNETNCYLWNYEVTAGDNNQEISSTNPVIIGHYAKDGLNGRGISQITEYYAVNNSSSTAPTGSDWKTTVQTTSNNNKYLWNYEVVTYTDGDSDETDPRIIGTYGNAGVNTATVYLYQRATSAPSKPSGNLTYTFSSASITSGTLGNWKQSIGELTGTNPIWVIAAVASSNGTTDIIASSDWSTQIKLAENGTNGTDGLNQATVFIYKRAASASKPASTSYTFSSGDFTVPSGWSKTIPASDASGNPCYVTSAVAIGNGSIATLNWVTPSILVEDGKDGVSPTVTSTENGVQIYDPVNDRTYNVTNGTNGISYYTHILYSSKAIPTSSSDVSTSPAGKSYVGIQTTVNQTAPSWNDSNWSWMKYIGDNGNSITISSIKYAKSTTDSQPSDSSFGTSIPTVGEGEWLWTMTTYSDSSKVYTKSKQGKSGTSVTVTKVEYQSGSSPTTAPTGTWGTSVPSVAEGNYLWTKTTYSDGNYSYTVAKQGQSGAPGTSVTISSTSIKYQVGTSATTAPTGTWQDTPQATAVNQFLWTRTIVNYSDNTSTTSYSVSAHGATGTSVGISSIKYAVSSTDSQPADSSFTYTSVPTVNEGQWLWAMTTYTNDSKMYTKSKQGKSGTNGISVTGVRELYYLKTNSTNPSQITSSSQITSTDRVNGWTSIVPSYVNNGVYYTCTETTLSSGGPVWSAPSENKGLTSANQKALDAYNTSVARDTEINALQAQAKYFWWNNEGAHIASGPESGNFDQDTFSTYGYNALMAPGYMALRYQDKNFAQLATNSLTFFRPATNGSAYVQGKKAMDLTADALTFYKPLAYNSSNNPAAAAVLNSTGLNIADGTIQLGTSDSSSISSGNVTLSNVDFNRSINGTPRDNLRLAIGQNFGVKNDGILYASNVEISGKITVGSGSNVYTKDEVGTAIDNIEVDGRNLLGGTSNKNLPSDTTGTATQTFGKVGLYNTAASECSLEDYDEYSNSIVITSTATGNRGIGWWTKVGDIEAGETYTVTCKVKSSVDVDVHTHTSWRNGSATATYTGWTNAGSQAIAANTWTTYSFAFTPATNAQLDWEFGIGICFTGKTTGVTFRIAHVKLEKGDKITDWTPAPEDVEANISDAAKTATSYITHINDQGIYISPSGVSPTVLSDPGNSVKIDGTGMEVYKGGTSVASYGDSARIGTEDGSAFHINSDSLEAYYIDENDNRNRYLYVTPEGITYGTNTVVASTEDIKELDGYWTVAILDSTDGVNVTADVETFIEAVTTVDSEGNATIGEQQITFTYNGLRWLSSDDASKTSDYYGVVVSPAYGYEFKTNDYFVLQAAFKEGLSVVFENAIEDLDYDLTDKIDGTRTDISTVSGDLASLDGKVTGELGKVKTDVNTLATNINDLTSDYETLKKGIVMDYTTPKISVYAVTQKINGEYQTVDSSSVDITSNSVSVVYKDKAIVSMYGTDDNDDEIVGAMRADNMITKYVYFRSDGSSGKREGKLGLVGRSNGHLSLKLM